MNGRPSQAAIDAAGEVFAVLCDTADRMAPRELAEASWTPTSRFTVDQLEDRIRRERGLPPIQRTSP